jgi:phage shock protein E
MKIDRISALVVVASIAALIACSPSPKQADETAPARGLSIEEAAWDAVDAGATLVDVRTQAEFDEGHLAGARHIPYDEITSRLGELPGDRNEAIVLYCRSGRRSGIAKQSLEQLGFSRVINGGGYEALKRAREN